MARRQPLAMGLDVLERKATQEVKRALGLASRQDALRYAVRLFAHGLRLAGTEQTAAFSAAFDKFGALQAFSADEKRRLEIARRGGRA